MGKFIQTLLLVAMATQATSFTSSSSILVLHESNRAIQRTNALFMAGFGGGAKTAKGKNKKKKDVPIKLKPKLQWDRYSALKTATRVKVGIRLLDEENSEWLSVGKVKSKSDEFITAAVAMQRGIIAEHGKRLHPLQVSKKSTCEWGYMEAGNDDESGGEWTVVDVKAALTDVPDGLEKDIGFEGIPDPATGFYCVYDNGRLKIGDETSFT